MKPLWALLALLLWPAAAPQAAIVERIATVPATIGGAAAPAFLPDPGTTLTAFNLATSIIGPQAIPLKEQTILDLGAGREAALARHLVAVQGFDPAMVHAADPALRTADVRPLRAENARRAKAEELRSDWAGKFDTVFSFFTFNPEIVHGDTPNMGDGIDVEEAAEAVHGVLKPGGRAVIVTGGANGLDPAAEAAFKKRLKLVKQVQDSFHVFEKAGR
jgi:SAM-dependent methyltransferase